MDEQLERAKAMVLELIQSHPNLTLSDEMPSCQGRTNRILFGTFYETPVVFKCFVTADRKHHEKKMLQLMAPSGTVPHLYPIETDRILVMERLSGEPLHGKLETLSDNEQQEIFRQIGRAFARVAISKQDDSAIYTSIEPKPGIDLPFYWTADLPSFYDYAVDTGLRVLEKRDVLARDLLMDTLRNLKHRRGEILSFPSFVHQDDVHLNNLIVEGTHFQGFIDLEMSRQGNKILLLAAALNMCRHTPSLWRSLRSGFEETVGTALDRNTLTLIRDVAAFNALIRFAWYWSSDDLPDWAIASNVRISTVEHVVDIVKFARDMP